jgi:hypothetical protein
LGLLKVRERELQREHGGMQVESVSREHVSALQEILNPTIT